MIQITSEQLPKLFKKIDDALAKQKRKIRVVVLGGLAIIAQGFRERATQDIDIAPSRDADVFETACNKLSIPVDIITIASTVDFNEIQTKNIFSGNHLIIDAVEAPDLIKLKLERFRKQDPDDIYAIITKTKMSYGNFKNLVVNMLPDFIGNPQSLILSA